MNAFCTLLTTVFALALSPVAFACNCEELRRLVNETQALIEQLEQTVNAQTAVLDGLVEKAGKLPGASAGKLKFGLREDAEGRSFLGDVLDYGFNIDTAQAGVFAEALTAGGTGSLASKVRDTVKVLEKAKTGLAFRKDLLARLSKSLAECEKKCGCSSCGSGSGSGK